MAATLTIDTIEGSELLLDADGGSRRVRMGTISDIDVVGEADPNVLEKALTVVGFPALGQEMPGNPGFVLYQVGVVGIFHNCVRVRLVYRPIEFPGIPGSAYIITDGSSTMQEPNVSIHEATGKSIAVGFDGYALVEPGDPISFLQHITIKAATVPMTVFRSLRRVEFQTIIPGQPDGSKNYAGYVNLSEWPSMFSPLGKGYWYLDSFKTTYSKYQGYYQISASAITRTRRNWMMDGVLIDGSTGKYAPVLEADVRAAIAREYVEDVIPFPRSGILTVGHYPLIDFATVFGF